MHGFLYLSNSLKKLTKFFHFSIGPLKLPSFHKYCHIVLTGSRLNRCSTDSTNFYRLHFIKQLQTLQNLQETSDLHSQRSNTLFEKPFSHSAVYPCCYYLHLTSGRPFWSDFRHFSAIHQSPTGVVETFLSNNVHSKDRNRATDNKTKKLRRTKRRESYAGHFDPRDGSRKRHETRRKRRRRGWDGIGKEEGCHERPHAFIAAHLAQQRAWKVLLVSVHRFPEPKYAHDYGVPDYQFVIPCLLFKHRFHADVQLLVVTWYLCVADSRFYARLPSVRTAVTVIVNLLGRSFFL